MPWILRRKCTLSQTWKKEAAPLLYKCIRPLWWYASRELKEIVVDEVKIQQHLDKIEYEQTREIDFAKHM